MCIHYSFQDCINLWQNEYMYLLFLSLFEKKNVNLFHLPSQDEKKRKQGGFRQERQKIELDAVFDTTCKKCGGKGK